MDPSFDWICRKCAGSMRIRIRTPDALEAICPRCGRANFIPSSRIEPVYAAWQAELRAAARAAAAAEKARMAAEAEAARIREEHVRAVERFQAAQALARQRVERKKMRAVLQNFYSKIAGVSHRNKDGVARQWLLGQLRAGDELNLVRDLRNPHDENAIKVLDMQDRLLGYIPAETSVDLAHAMDIGGRAIAQVAELTGGGADMYLGCNILIHYEVV